MDVTYLSDILKKVSDNSMDVDTALESLKHLPYEDIGYANIDQHRNLRTGEAEVIFGQSKTPEQIAGIVTHMMHENARILVTRASEAAYEAVKEVAPEAVYEKLSKIIMVGKIPVPKEEKGTIAVVTAGTSDIPVAEEAALTAEFLGNKVDRVYDVGVAGIHRLFGKIDQIRYGRCAGKCCWRSGGSASDRSADQCWLWCKFWWPGSITFHAEQLCERNRRSEY